MKINRIISQLVIEIIIITITIIGTYFIWDRLDYETQAKMAYAYSNYDARLTLNITENDNNSIISIGNSNSITKEYELYLKINKVENKIYKDYIMVCFDENNYSLNDFNSFEKGNYIYYIIEKGTIKRKSKLDSSIKVYLLNNTQINEENTQFNYLLDLKEI